MKLYLVRHAETTQNAAGFLQGMQNFQLSALGHKQTELLAKHLKNIPFVAAYASTLDRARDTAKVIADEKNIPLICTSDLCELDYGIYEGMPHTEFRKIRDAVSIPFEELQYEGGEHYQSAIARAKKFLQEIKNKHQGEHILVVSHGSFLRVLFSVLTGKKIKTIYEELPTQKNTAVTIVDWHEEPRIERIASSEHLDI